MGSNHFAVRLWRHTSLMQRLGFIALVPTLVTAVILVSMLTRHQLATIRSMAQDTASAIATQTAAIASRPLQQQQRRELARIAQAVGGLPHVVHVQIRSSVGEILAEYRDNTTHDRRNQLTVLRSVANPDRPNDAALGSVLVQVSVAQALAAQQASLNRALITLAISLLITAILGWQAARWLSAPLRRLVIAVQQLGRGDRAVAVEITDRMEIGQLQRGFNHAATALFDMHREMERKIEHATQEVARKNAALEAA
ncbi:MAG: HAMP domain-containing protein, partial [Rhodanobacter sp.]